jgi:hypothetical protein
MNKPLLVLATTLSLSTLGAAQTPLFTTPHNELRNPDFETITQDNKISEWTLPDGATSDTQIFRQGQKSLKLQAKPAQQSIDTLIPGTKIRFGAWVRGEGVQGDVILKVSGKDAVAQTAPLTGTFDWTWRETTFTLPDVPGAISVELIPGTEGTVWFDGMVVQPQLEPMQVFLRRPNYRNLLPVGNRGPLQAQIELVDSKELPSQLTVAWELKDSKGKVLTRGSKPLPTSTLHYSIEAPLKSSLPVGEYRWDFALKSANGQPLQQVQKAIQVVAKMPEVYLDHEGRTIRNGKPFFTLGIYLGEKNDSTADHLQRIAKAGFNTVLDYQHGHFQEDAERYMDDAQKNNLAVIFSLKDLYNETSGAFVDPKLDANVVAEKLVSRVKNHPALLAWYTNDESAPAIMPLLQQRYDALKKWDKNHPTFITLFREGQYGKYFPTTDITSSDWYPYGWAPWSDVSKLIRETRDSTRGSLGLWTVTQIHNGTLYRGGDTPQLPDYTPTYEGMKNFAFQAIAEGSNGVIFYSYFDLWYDSTKREKKQAAFDERWPDVARLASELRSYAPVLENGETVPAKVVSGDLAVRVLKYQNKLYLFTANPMDEARTLSVQLPGAWKAANPVSGTVSVANNQSRWEYQIPSRASGLFVLNAR